MYVLTASYLLIQSCYVCVSKINQSSNQSIKLLKNNVL